jgi:hypothetical protein
VGRRVLLRGVIGLLMGGVWFRVSSGGLEGMVFGCCFVYVFGMS